MLLISMLSFQGNAQENAVLPIPQYKAEPVEGMQKFYASFVHNFSPAAVQSELEYAKARLVFFVESDGSFSEITAEGEEVEVNEEVVRVMKLMPNWKPATSNGEPVRSKFIMPVKIKIYKDNPSNQQ